MKRLFLFGLLLSAFPVAVMAQTNVNTDVDRTSVYEQVVREGYGTPKIYKELGNGHYFKGNYAEAKKWFEKLFETEPPTDPKMKFRYRQTLKALNEDIANNPYLSDGLAKTDN